MFSTGATARRSSEAAGWAGWLGATAVSGGGVEEAWDGAEGEV